MPAIELPAAVTQWLSELPSREQWMESGELEQAGIVGQALLAIDEEPWSEKSTPFAANHRLLQAYLTGSAAVREAMDLVLIELSGYALLSLAEKAMPAEAFDAYKAATEVKA